MQNVEESVRIAGAPQIWNETLLFPGDKRFLRSRGSKRGFFLLPPFPLQLPRDSEPISCQFFFLSPRRWMTKTLAFEVGRWSHHTTNERSNEEFESKEWWNFRGRKCLSFFFFIEVIRRINKLNIKSILNRRDFREIEIFYFFYGFLFFLTFLVSFWSNRWAQDSSKSSYHRGVKR